MGPSGSPDAPIRNGSARVYTSPIALKILAAMIGSLMMSGIVTFVVDSRLASSALRDQAHAQLRDTLGILEAEYEIRVSRLRQDMRSLADVLGTQGRDPLERMDDLIAELARFQRTSGADIAMVLDSGGRPVAAVGEPLQIDRTPPPANVREGSARLVRTATGRIVQAIYVPFGAGRDRSLALGAFQVDDRLAFDLRNVVQHHVLLVDRRRILGATLGSALTEPPGLSDGIRGEEPRAVRIGETDMLVGYAPITSGGGGPRAYLGIALPERAGGLAGTLLRGRALASALPLVAALFLTWFLLRSLVQPLVRLASAARGIDPTSIGDGPARSFDSIGQALGQVQNTLTELQNVDEAKSMFVATAAHELRSPLSAIAGLSATLAEHRKHMSSDVQDEIISALARQSDELMELAQRLLDLTQLQRGTMRVEMRDTMVREAVDAAIGSAPPPAGVRLDIDVPRGLDVRADRVRLTEALVNLLTNAYRYGGRTITIRARAIDGLRRITVADDGPGLPETVVEHLFEPLAVSERSEGGTGLGLSMVRSLIEVQGGTIEYVPAHPGSRFVIQLQPASARGRERSHTT